jgi:PAS domain S-box-containing protein
LGLRQPDGRLAWVIATALPLFEEESATLLGALASFVDITNLKLAEESLRQSEDRYRQLVEHSPDAIIVHHDRRIVFANDAAVRLWGAQSRDQILGRNVLDFIHPRYRDAVASRIRNAEHGGVAPLTDSRNIRLDGRVVDVEAIATPCIYDGVPCIQAVIHDITRRKQAERRLRKQRELLRTVFDFIPVMIALVDPRGRVHMANREYERLLGWARDKASLQDALAKQYPDPRQLEEVATYIEEAPPGWRDFRTRLPDGRVIDTSWANIKLSDGSVIGIGQDVTEQRRAAQALIDANAELERRVAARTEELSNKNEELEREVLERRRAETRLKEQQEFLQKMLEAHERDRQLVAYEIHDTFVQDVIGALMHIDAFYAQASPSGEGSWQDFELVRKLLRKAVDEARRMISGLRPPIIDEQGLVAAIDYLVSEVRQRGSEIRFVHNMAQDRLPSLFEATVFRIVQEAINNLERHSGSEYGEISLTQTDGSICLVVRDFGIGFDPDQIGSGHFGLQGMRERTRLVDGTLAINSAPGKGTEIVFELPASSLR